MKIFYLLLIFVRHLNGMLPEFDKEEFCDNLECDESEDRVVCGVRYEEDEVTFKLFPNECKLLQYGCQVDDSQTYGIISMKHCGGKSSEKTEHVKFVECPDCSSTVTADPVCGIRREGEGFKIRSFQNECILRKYNCDYDLEFTVTDFFICANSPDEEEENEAANEIIDKEKPPVEPEENEKNNVIKTKNIVIVDGSMMDMHNINESINNFFSATHVFDLPMRDMAPMLNNTARRMLIRMFGPTKIFVPWTTVPKNISDDYYHKPTVNSCYHKCPVKCPDTYAPVCGVPGQIAREPSLMFQNHCYMDVAQCKMSWEDKSYTSGSSRYIESAFYFCLGDELNGVYRFLPLVKTLQHMGRLKNKSNFRHKFQNMRFWNNMLPRSHKIMG